MLAAATVCAIAHYAFGDWTRYPGVVLWRERAFWAGMPAAAVVPMLHWVGWSALSLGRLKAARVILVAGLALGLGDLVWLLVWLNLNAVSGLFKVPLESVTVGYWDFWAWWMPAVVLAGNAVLARRWWRLARTSYARVAADVRACCPSPFPGGRASPRALISFVLCAIWARGDARPPISLLSNTPVSRRHLASNESAPTGAGGCSPPAKPEPREHSRFSILLRGIATLAGSWVVLLVAVYLVLPRMRVNETTLSLAATVLVSARWERDFDFLARDPAMHGKRLGAILAHAELAHLQRRQFYEALDESTYQQFVLSPIVDALPISEVDWRRTLWEAFYPRVRNEHDPVAGARVVVRLLRERVGIDPSYSYRVGPETIWELGMADEKGFARICVAALRSVGIAARLDDGGKAEFWDGRAWPLAPRPLVGFCSGGPLTRSLSPSEGERMPSGRVRGLGTFSAYTQ